MLYPYYANSCSSMVIVLGFAILKDHCHQGRLLLHHHSYNHLQLLAPSSFVSASNLLGPITNIRNGLGSLPSLINNCNLFYSLDLSCFFSKQRHQGNPNRASISVLLRARKSHCTLSSPCISSFRFTQNFHQERGVEPSLSTSPLIFSLRCDHWSLMVLSNYPGVWGILCL